MANTQITLFRGYAEDQRISMEIYADGLARSLRDSCTAHTCIHTYRPKLPRGIGNNAWSLRFARYGAYPLQARAQQGQLNHVLDQGYGHLLYVLDPRRTVVTVHDLIPLVRWRGVIPGIASDHKPWLNLISLYALRRAIHLIADSENTRRDLIRYCECRPENISVVPPGVDATFRQLAPVEKARARQALGLPDGDAWIVLLSGSQFYKNQTGALRAFARLRSMVAKPLYLVKMGGPNAEWATAVQELGLAEVTLALGYVPRTQVPGLLNSVDCLLMPSWYEGFGWPPLEAMACGIPVVSSNAGSLPEVVGDAGLLCSPHDINALAQALFSVLTDNTVRHLLIERGLANASRFTWERTAREIAMVYDQVAKQ